MVGATSEMSRGAPSAVHAQPIAASAASVAYPWPQAGRASFQPISRSGQPGGFHSPTRPRKAPSSRRPTAQLRYPHSRPRPGVGGEVLEGAVGVAGTADEPLDLGVGRQLGVRRDVLWPQAAQGQPLGVQAWAITRRTSPQRPPPYEG